MCEVFLRLLGIEWGEGGTRYRCFNRGYHDLGLLQVDYHYLFYVHMSSGLLFLCYEYVIVGIISKIYLKLYFKTSML
jgi:hypothetical protein